MKLKAGTIVTVKLDDEELQFRIVHTDGDGKEKMSLETPLARLLSAIAVGETVRMWTPAVHGAEPMRVEFMGVEEATK